MTEFNLDSLLADILDDNKPLPSGTVDLKPSPTIITTITREGERKVEGGDLPAGMVVPGSKEDIDSLFENVTPVQAKSIGVAIGQMAQDARDLNSLLSEALHIQPQQAGQLDAFPVPEAPQSTAPDTTDYTLPPLPMPNFTSEELAHTLDLRNFATMATLHTKRWHAKVKDRKSGHDIAVANDADETAFETRKRLLAGADTELKAIHKAIDTARAKYYGMTLPWTTTGLDDVGRRSGARIMPNTQFFEFVTEMGNCKAEMVAALDKFVPLYPQLVQEARKKLGRRFDQTEYPPAEAIRSYFDLTFDFMPIPEGGDFKGLPQQQCDALANALASKTRTMVENAMQDLWKRAHEAIGRMAERLSHPDKLFHYTLVDNVRQVSNQLKHLNVTDDPRIRDLQQYVEQYLTKHEVDDLRKNPVLRAQIGAYAQDAMEKMARIAGA
jgi:hypothetical protein